MDNLKIYSQKLRNISKENVNFVQRFMRGNEEPMTYKQNHKLIICRNEKIFSLVFHHNKISGNLSNDVNDEASEKLRYRNLIHYLKNWEKKFLKESYQLIDIIILDLIVLMQFKDQIKIAVVYNIFLAKQRNQVAFSRLRIISYNRMNIFSEKSITLFKRNCNNFDICNCIVMT